MAVILLSGCFLGIENWSIAIGNGTLWKASLPATQDTGRDAFHRVRFWALGIEKWAIAAENGTQWNASLPGVG